MSLSSWITAIDVGYSNPGIIVVSYTVDPEETPIKVKHKIEFFDKPDLAVIHGIHIEVSKENCTLLHTNELTDKIDHFIQEYQSWLIGVQIQQILIEDQPPLGLTNVEQLILKSLPREKTKLISPKSVHKFLKIQHLDYEHRKLFMEDLLQSAILETNPNLLPIWQSFQRQHDMADAYGLILYYLSTLELQMNEQQMKVIRKMKQKELFERDGMFDFEQFRFQPTTPIIPGGTSIRKRSDFLRGARF